MGRAALGTVRRLPSGRWQARMTERGRRVSLGSFSTRREATRVLARASTEAALGTWVAPAAGRESLGDWAERWWQTRGGHRESTRLRDRSALDGHVLPALGDRALGEITRAQVQGWVNERGSRLAPTTVQRSYTILAQLLGAAADVGLIAATPAIRIRLPRRQRFEARFLTPAELERLCRAIDPPYRAMVLTMAWATLRLGEAVGLRRADLDLDAGTLRVANAVVTVNGRRMEGPPKTAAGRRTMTLPASVIDDLAAHLIGFAGQLYVFPGPEDGPLSGNRFRSGPWRRAVTATGLGPLRIHDLKHSGVAFLAAAGVDPSEIARRAGHTSVAFTYDRYGHLLPEVDKQAATKLDALRARTTK